MRLISGDRSLSREALDEQVELSAKAMRQMGVKPGDAVALLLRNDFPFLITSLAARAIGVYATPINWHGTLDEVTYILHDSGARLLVGHEDLLAKLGGTLDPSLAVVSVVTPPEIAAAYRLDSGLSGPGGERWITWSDWIETGRIDLPPLAAVQASSMIYTSGTTGRPKGVRRVPRDSAQVADARENAERVYGLGDKEPIVVLMNGPMYHSAPNAYALTAAGVGAAIVFEPRFDAEDMLALIEHHRVTHMHMVPTMFVRLLKLPDDVKARYDVSSLRFVVHGAAPCPIALKQAMIAWWGPVINEYYGSTETGIAVWHDAEEALRKPGTVGRVLPGAAAAVYDETGNKLPPCEIGDIYMRAHGMADFSYHGRDDARGEIWRDGLVTVGDVGWIDADGYVFLSDRRRDMIISGGVNIYPAEIEAALLALPGVQDCAVFGIPDEEFSEAICAYVQPEPGRTMTADEVRAGLAKTLSRFKLPKVVEFSAQLPREDSGKIFKRKLREPYWATADRKI